jgi:N-acetylglutamate synthase-like GNAT family acetyltransferase
METPHSSQEYSLRLATAADAPQIRRIISLVQINPTSLNWQRFVLAVDREGKIIACGQVKPHADGSLELASIAVLPDWRGKGIARTIIERLLDKYPSRLYLTCRSKLGPLYQRFGFQTIGIPDMPPYFRRLRRLVALFNKLFHQSDHLLVMRRN